MRAFKITVASIAVWSALSALVWPHTSFSGADGEIMFREIELQSRTLSPTVSESCRTDLFTYGREKIKAKIAMDYPSAYRFYRNAETAATRYLDASCPTGALLGVTALVTERAGRALSTVSRPAAEAD